MFTPTAERVSQNTSDAANARIRYRTEVNVARYSAAGPEVIKARLEELDREWDIERYLETMAPSFTLLGLALGMAVNKKWLILPAVVQSFFLQHALQGWCPPIPVLRGLGVRTANEINEERCALKALRGDFDGIAGGDANASRVMDAVRA